MTETETPRRTLEIDDRGLVVACPRCSRRNRFPFRRVGSPARCAQCHANLPQPSVPIDVESAAIFDLMVRESTCPILVDFWAPWCGPCKMVAPEITKAATSGAGKWLVLKVNTDTLPDLAQRFKVTGIPLLVLFRAGREVARQAGAMPERGIIEFITHAPGRV